MSTVEELTIQALARCAEYGNDYPTTRSVLYRRLGVRQQQLFAAAARANPEYFGATALGTLDSNGAISLSTLGDPAAADPTPNMELLSRIEVAANDGSEGALDVGTEVHVVVVTDALHAVLPPRVTVRGGVIASVGSDLAHVTQLFVYYSRRPFRLNYDDKATLVELPEPFQELLVIDLARFNLRKMASLTKEVRQVALAALDAEEQEGVANFIAAVQAFTSAVETGRFSRTQGSTRQ
jgi:hypothetical protein